MQREQKVVENARGMAVHVRLKKAAHHNYTDFGLLSPIVSRLLGLAGKEDPVQLQILVNKVVGEFILFDIEGEATKQLEGFKELLKDQYAGFFDFLN
jgi:hypothetical protein